MGSGGKTTSSTTLPSYITNYGQGILNSASNDANQPFQSYSGQLVAPQNSYETSGESNSYNNAFNFMGGLSNANNATSTLSSYLANNGVPSSSQVMDYANNGQSPTSQQLSGLFGSMPSVSGSAATNATNTSNNTQALDAYNSLGGVSGYASSDYGNSGAQNWNGQTASQYMSPYIQSSLNPQLQVMKQQLGQQQNDINAQATQSNAFGDSRQAVASSLANQNADLQMQNVESTGLNDAYENAQSQFNTNNEQRLGAYNSGLSAGQQGLSTLTDQQLQNAQLALSGVNSGASIDSQNYNNALSGLTGAAGVNQAQEGLNLQGVSQGLNAQGQQTSDYTSLINSLLGNTTTGQSLYNTAGNTQYSAGQAQQNQQQNEDNAAYQQFLRQINYPYQMLELQEGALGSVPYNTTTTNRSQSSLLGTLTGGISTGIGALGSLAGSQGVASFLGL